MKFKSRGIKLHTEKLQQRGTTQKYWKFWNKIQCLHLSIHLHLTMDINLTESESRYYNDLFSLCDVEKIGKIQYLKSQELFRSSSIDNQVLNQVNTIWLQCFVKTYCFGGLSWIARQKTRFFWEGQQFSFSRWIFVQSSARSDVNVNKFCIIKLNRPTHAEDCLAASIKKCLPKAND